MKVVAGLTLVASMLSLGESARTRSRFQVTGEIETYPGYTGPIQIEGKVSLSKNNVLRYKVSGMEPNSIGGFHIHAGTSCETHEEVLGHYYTGETDGWESTTWSSNRRGRGAGGIEVDSVSGAYSFDDNLDHVVVFHANDGTRIGCATLGDLKGERLRLTAKMRGYPNSELKRYERPHGEVHLRQNSRMVLRLFNLPPNAEGGVHIHTGTSCRPVEDSDEVGGHFYEGEVDGWIPVKWASDATGKAIATINLNEYEGIPRFEASVGHAVVIHAPGGSRIGCGVLRAYAKDERRKEDRRP